jgi:hypothetical protein
MSVTATRYSTLMGACFLLPPVGLLMQQIHANLSFRNHNIWYFNPSMRR